VVVDQVKKAGVNPAFFMKGLRCVLLRAVHVPLGDEETRRFRRLGSATAVPSDPAKPVCVGRNRYDVRSADCHANRSFTHTALITGTSQLAKNSITIRPCGRNSTHCQTNAASATPIA
jgi:hypothetical protein